MRQQLSYSFSALLLAGAFVGASLLSLVGRKWGKAIFVGAFDDDDGFGIAMCEDRWRKRWVDGRVSRTILRVVRREKVGVFVVNNFQVAKFQQIFTTNTENMENELKT